VELAAVLVARLVALLVPPARIHRQHLRHCGAALVLAVQAAATPLARPGQAAACL